MGSEGGVTVGVGTGGGAGGQPPTVGNIGSASGSSVSNFLGSSLGKAAIGAGLAAAQGALADDPRLLSTFLNATGDSGLPFAGEGTRTVDPTDLLAAGTGRNELLFNEFAKLAGQGTQLGPASIIQQAPFAFGGALPAPIGIGIRDPGFLQRPGSARLASLGGSPFGGIGGGGGGGGGGNGDSDDPDEISRPTNPDLPDDPLFPGDAPGDNPIPLPKPPGNQPIPTSFTGGGLPTAIPTQRGELSQFLDAVNVANMNRGRPIVRGGLR